MTMGGQSYTNESLLDSENKNKFLYNGKELEEETQWLSYGFREYDPQIGRWHVKDALSEEYFSHSPYAYVMNNPVSSIDILGLNSAAAVHEKINGGTGQYFNISGYFGSGAQRFGFNTGPNFYESHTYMEGTHGSGWIKNSNITTYCWKTTVSIVDVPNIFGQDVDGKIPSYLSAMKVHSVLVDVSKTKGHFVSDDGREFWSGYEVENVEPRDMVTTGYPPGVGPYKAFNILKTIRGFRNILKGLVRLFTRNKKSNLEIARKIGIEAEKMVGTTNPKTRIPSLTGTAKYRIPDALDELMLDLTEVKNVKHLSLTSQIKDFHLYSMQNGLDFHLYVRSSTTFSRPLQKLINNGNIIIHYITGL